MNKRIIDRTFFTRDVLEVAPDLLGCKLVRVINGGEIKRYIITEVEAYNGVNDLACHASKGKTSRTEVMYSNGGVLYIFLIYGIHWMLNIVTSIEDNPQAVLIRGISQTSGPGRLTKALGIDKSFNGVDLCRSENIWLEKKEFRPNFITGPRIGVEYAGEYWANMPWRFILTR